MKTLTPDSKATNKDFEPFIEFRQSGPGERGIWQRKDEIRYENWKAVRMTSKSGPGDDEYWWQVTQLDEEGKESYYFGHGPITVPGRILKCIDDLIAITAVACNATQNGFQKRHEQAKQAMREALGLR